MCSCLRGISRWFTPLACGPGAPELSKSHMHMASSYKRVKGRSHTVEKRISMHLHKSHTTSQPSRCSHTQTQHRLHMASKLFTFTFTFTPTLRRANVNVNVHVNSHASRQRLTPTTATAHRMMLS